ncbi:hypothetical protein SAZ11_60070 [Streptomyces sp. FXJ1.4098]|nr:hypothetical protein [Streptomyces sp. FXJ1.4098]
MRRWLADDALNPWQQRSWIFITDPDFRIKPERALGLYARTWQGVPLGEDEYVISADEKTSIQARCRCHPTLAPARPARCASTSSHPTTSPTSPRSGTGSEHSKTDTVCGSQDLATGVGEVEFLHMAMVRVRTALQLVPALDACPPARPRPGE